MDGMSRRELLARSAATGAGIFVGSSVLSLAQAGPAGATPLGGYGPLVPDPAGLLDLPAGFTYKVLSRSGDYPGIDPDLLPTGDPVPAANDGTGAFGNPGRRITLVRNHECAEDDAPGVPHTGAAVYDPDPAAIGGTVNVVLDRNADLLAQYVSLAGTITNCAGGVTPWRTWLTCEENQDTLGKTHGWVFEVDPRGLRTDAEPITAMGRMDHEAVCIDPVTLIAYLTEDADEPNGLFFRFLPDLQQRRYGLYHQGGSLQAMRSASVRQLDEVTEVGTVLDDIGWVPVPDPSAAVTQIREQFTEDQITRSRKYEGLWWGNGAAWLNCSYSDRPGFEHSGQVWKYDPAANTLTLLAYFPVGGLFDGPDNITVSPHGGLFLAEDGDGDQYVVGLDEAGTAYAFAQNKLLFDGDYSEFTGVCFSPDSRWMFVNVQGPGITYAITGPWTGTPAPVISEAPTALLLPLGAAAVGAGALYLRNRRTTPAAL